ncbi:hypothetical protein BDB01DRAFT_845483 [Pilobolus umbonatus]|nr:hypothetical protein BDB01DRAFT_845483 [Pilobolus umbonatus]
MIDINTLTNEWNLVSSNDNLGSEARSDGQMIASADGTKMYLQGGYNGDAKVVKDSFIVYDATTNSWSSLPDYKQFNIQDGIIRRASVAYVPTINKLVFYGGLTQSFQNQSVNVDGIDIPPEEDKGSFKLKFGFHNLTTFDLKTHQWEQISNATGQLMDSFIYGLKTLYWPGYDTSFYFDGSTVERKNTTYEHWQPFDYLEQVTYPGYRWEHQLCHGSIPTKRDYYTNTLLPDNKTMIMFGGTYDYLIALYDYCHLLNLYTREWRPCSVQMPVGVTASRYGHSAVLVGDHLFIISGRDNNGNILNDIVILDISDVDNIKYVKDYAYKMQGNEEIQLVADKESGGLSGGAIAGIVIGCIAVAIIVAVILYLRKRKAKKTESISEFPADWNQLHPDLSDMSQTQKESEVVEYPPNNSTKFIQSTTQHNAGIVYPSTASSNVNGDYPYRIIKPVENGISKPST